MPSGPEMMRNFNNPEEDNLQDLFVNTPENPLELPQSEVSQFEHEITKEVTPETVAKAWGKLSDIEKKFITSPQEQFDSIIPEYESKHGEKKAGAIRVLRKLILKHDPLVGLIEN